MNEIFADIRMKIAQVVKETAPSCIQGGEVLEALVPRVEVNRVDIGSNTGTEQKWLVRGSLKLHLFNLDDELFGKVRLHLIASGHGHGSEASVDSLLISPHIQ